MISDERDDVRLDELLRRHYAPLAVASPEQREAVLAALAEARADGATNPVRPSPSGPRAWPGWRPPWSWWRLASKCC